MLLNIENSSWLRALAPELEKPYFQKLTKFVEDSYQNDKVFPAPENIFKAFSLCDYADVKVIILGQDPYHGANQAVGLSFSVPESERLPPSLRNIYKELKSDIARDRGINGNLKDWAKEGVLLLNATLTVSEGKPGSHQTQGWETFSDAVIKHLSEQKENLVFILWGKYAEAKAGLIDKDKHLIITSAHPSPLSAHRGFFGSRPFSKTNEYLKQKGLKPIAW